MDLKICRICLRTGVRVYNYDKFQLKSYYEEVLAFKVTDQDGLPQYFCYECATLLHKFHKFKEKCYSGQKVLKDILWRAPISYEAIYKIDPKDYGLQPTLQKSSTTTIIHSSYEDREHSVDIKTENHTIIQESDDAFTDNEYRNDEPSDRTKIEDELSHHRRSSKSEDEQTLADIKKESEQNSARVRRKRKVKHYNNDGEETNIRDMILTSDHWKVFELNEEEAVKAFQSKSEDKKYLEAAFKCTDCFKGFSKEMTLKRHIKLRHSESIGKFECRFCHARFRMDCYLKRHMRQHYSKYKCLRCSLVCDLEYTAFLHNEYHSGVARKCVYCEQEFRHSSTYYSHLRTHRSEFVCSLCGASFVSDIGLQQHKRITHVVDEVEQDDDDDESVNTYCGKCEIRFETRKAYKEHLFHSVMHTEEQNADIEDDETMPRKVLGKKMQDKITNEIQNVTPSQMNFPAAYKKKKWGRARRATKKPTTCHQCGKRFETQLACMKHHVAEHPRTSFFPPTERHICEICGVSLAPSSIASHQNMHTRQVLHSCHTCGRQFHSSMSYKRHQLTHTGEKPYACTLCDKRFTQSNSMKLHYRTFHLKEPYPKRNRRKKKEEQKVLEACRNGASEESDDSAPERKQTEPVTAHVMDNDHMDFLTLA